jgi:hypothetical protein
MAANVVANDRLERNFPGELLRFMAFLLVA